MNEILAIGSAMSKNSHSVILLSDKPESLKYVISKIEILSALANNMSLDTMFVSSSGLF